jgi:DNA-binding transcriptional MerR regulator
MMDATPIEIPNRALFKPAEVCELLHLQPYVLRTWEAEFPQLGVAKTGGLGRVYRRQDVEQVQRIKHLLLVEGLTLAGARRKLEEDIAPIAASVPEIDELLGMNARQRLTEVKRGLRSILELLSGAGVHEFALTPMPVRVAMGADTLEHRTAPVRTASKPKPASPKSASSPRRKR